MLSNGKKVKDLIVYNTITQAMDKVGQADLEFNVCAKPFRTKDNEFIVPIYEDNRRKSNDRLLMVQYSPRDTKMRIIYS